MKKIASICAVTFVAAFCLLMRSNSAQAADAGLYAAPETISGPAASFTLYGWLAGIDGRLGVNGLGPVGVSGTGGDTFDVLEGFFMANGNIRWDNYGLFADFIYLGIGDSKATPGPLYSSADLDMKAYLFTVAGTYRLLETEMSWLEVMAGARLWSVDMTLSLTTGILPGTSAGDVISWVDPLVGLRGHHYLSNKIFLTGSAMVGGFGAGSKSMWDVFGGVGYAFSKRFLVTLGYRALDVNYNKSGDVVDVIAHGPLAAATLDF